MVTRDMVERWLREAFLSQYEWLAEYIAAVTNMMAKSAELKEEVPAAVRGALGAIKKCARRPGAEGVRTILVEHLEFTAFVMDCPAEVLQLPIPDPPHDWNANDASSEEREFRRLRIQQDLVKLDSHRSRATLERGQRLVDAAMTLLGKYKWVPSSLDGNRSFFPSERTTDTDTDEPTANDFALWINRHRPLTDVSKLNCWEAVFVCATTAGLLSEQQLRMNYVASAVVATRATLPRTDDQKAREESVGRDYLLRVMLRFDHSVPLVPGTPLMPAPGDVIFIDDDHHVVICSSVDAHRGFDGIKVISHWKHPKHGLLNLPLDSWGELLLRNVRFTPCPF